MSSELGNFSDGVPERFVPELMRGELAEAEHYSRYWWAAALITGGRVLDAGCGTAYGTEILAGAATEVVGVDIASAVLEAAKPRIPDNARLEVADLRSLPFEDGSFDSVVCFEAIEHVDEPLVILDELRRILTDHGVLVVSSPNRERYVPGNPHHHHEFDPDELREELSKRFTNVQLYHQSDWIVSAILDDVDFGADLGHRVAGMELRKGIGAEPGTEEYTIAIASSGDLPVAGPLATMTHPTELHRWMGLWDEQRSIIQQNVQRAERAESMLAERAELRRQLAQAEQGVAPLVAARMAEVERSLLDLKASTSWRVTAPLRLASDRIRAFRNR